MAIHIRRWLPLTILASLFLLFFLFHLHQYLTFEAIQQYQFGIKQWTLAHHDAALTLYVLVFILLLACAIPGGTILCLLGGFLFGIAAFFYALFATTAGGLILCLAVRSAFGATGGKQRYQWLKNVESGFQKNAFYYLLMLRVMPFCPCWVSNISAGVLNVPLRTFLLATLMGVAPATLIYVLAGRSLDKIMTAAPAQGFSILAMPSILLPLIGLALLSLSPIFYKAIKKSAQT
jgi:uncharacterized membrane protein YdjX (TVP38/TMEM64 family)